MKLRLIRSIKNLKGKTVLLRADFNVPVTNGRVDDAESFRLERVVPTIELLLRRGARVILLSHRGRPEGKIVDSLRLAPVASRLQQLLHAEKNGVEKWGVKSHPSISRLFPSYTIVTDRLWMLENLRFDPREEENDAVFAKALASMGHVYVNDAFAVSHRKNASVHAITKYLPSYAGLLMEEEVQHLSSIFEKPSRPLVVVLGGAKISTKIGLIKRFLAHADQVLLGGGLANTVLAARGYAVGTSLIEKGGAAVLRGVLQHPRLVLPIDARVRSAKKRVRSADVRALRANEAILDIGPKTIDRFSSYLMQARMIVWNGPVGVFEERQFAQGTFALLRAALKNTRATMIIGGGETVTAYRQFGRNSKLKTQKSKLFLSTGGGAMLEFLEKGMLPGIQPLVR